MLDRSAKEELLWWVNQLSTWNGRAILPQPPDLIVETDASLLGWGAVSEGIRTGGLWSEEERAQHINLLELKGGAMAVKMFASTRGTHVRLRMNNKTTMNNGIADEESRTMQSSAEWKLNSQVFICILQAMDPCQIDLFATRLNHQLNRYVSW